MACIIYWRRGLYTHVVDPRHQGCVSLFVHVVKPATKQNMAVAVCTHSSQTCHICI